MGNTWRPSTRSQNDVTRCTKGPAQRRRDGTNASRRCTHLADRAGGLEHLVGGDEGHHECVHVIPRFVGRRKVGLGQRLPSVELRRALQLALNARDLAVGFHRGVQVATADEVGYKLTSVLGA